MGPKVWNSKNTLWWNSILNHRNKRFNVSMIKLHPFRHSLHLKSLTRRVSKTLTGSCPVPYKSHRDSRCFPVLYAMMATASSNVDPPRPSWADKLKFDNLVLRSLPIDKSYDSSQRQVPGSCFSLIKPTPVDNPQLVCAAPNALRILDITEEDVETDDFVNFFSGNKIMTGSETAAHCYCGHQFGYFSGQLGDGAAMYLGEIINKAGERWEVQLKGAGKTPFSRTADGRKVLRSTIREFLCSEAIHNLGIPSTRAGSCITSESTVVRDIFYDGNPILEKCTIVLRMAPTFIRFGSFEITKPTDRETGMKGPSHGNYEILKTLLDYTIQTFYPEIWSSNQEDSETMYVEFYKEVVRRTARMVAQWQCVGWCHGVLNTDNMSIVGVTIDYGPFGFMDKYDPDYICNASDDGGRYTYRKQPEMCKWNCMKLGDSIKELVPTSKTRPHLDLFDQEFDACYTAGMKNKFGIQKEVAEDSTLIQDFLITMKDTGGDFTNCFRHLSDLPLPSSPAFQEGKENLLNYLMSQSSSLEEMKASNKPRMDRRQLGMLVQIAQTNPELLQALGKGGNLLMSELKRMEVLEELEKMSSDAVESKNREKWSSWLEKYEERLKKEEEGVDDRRSFEEERRRKMNAVNPRYILRNYIAQNAIDAATKGDYSEVKRVLRLLESPYDEGPTDDLVSVKNEATAASEKQEAAAATSCSQDVVVYDDKPPMTAQELRVT